VKFKIVAALLCATAMAAPASSQVRRPPPRPAPAPAVSIRPFVVLTGERFTAGKTFEAVFGKSLQPFWGGGLNMAFKDNSYLDVTASRFKKNGERAFLFEGQRFGLGIPLTVTLTAIEVTGGGRYRVKPRIFLYVGLGAGSYRYEETSEFDDGPFAKSHIGYLAAGGLEFRISRWVGVTGDAQWTRVSGIIGDGGVSKEAGENDLGGIAGRFRVIIGR
jgi:hypothetical protein